MRPNRFLGWLSLVCRFQALHEARKGASASRDGTPLASTADTGLKASDPPPRKSPYFSPVSLLKPSGHSGSAPRSAACCQHVTSSKSDTWTRSKHDRTPRFGHNSVYSPKVCRWSSACASSMFDVCLAELAEHFDFAAGDGEQSPRSKLDRSRQFWVNSEILRAPPTLSQRLGAHFLPVRTCERFPLLETTTNRQLDGVFRRNGRGPWSCLEYFRASPILLHLAWAAVGDRLRP